MHAVRNDLCVHVVLQVKLLRCIPEAKLSDVVLGQYVGSLQAEGGAKAGYQDDESVPDGSLAPTFATVVLQIKNERWMVFHSSCSVERVRHYLSSDAYVLQNVGYCV